MEEIILVEKTIGKQALKDLAEQQFGDMVKAVVDLDKNIMAIGGDLHADEEAFLLERGASWKIYGALTFMWTWKCRTCWNLIPW